MLLVKSILCILQGDYKSKPMAQVQRIRHLISFPRNFTHGIPMKEARLHWIKDMAFCGSRRSFLSTAPA